MKRKNYLIVTLCIVMLSIGFIIGMSVNNAFVDTSQLLGTIAKPGALKVSEEDIMLKEDLMADVERREALMEYLSFYYARAIQLDTSIDFALNAAQKSGRFKRENTSNITLLEGYSAYLKKSRPSLLMAINLIKNGEDANPALVKYVIMQALDIVAQTNYRNNSVINFIVEIDRYVDKNRGAENARLMKAHDLLVFAEAVSTGVTGDNVLQKFIDDITMFGNEFTLTRANSYSSIVKSDLEQLVASENPGLEVEYLDEEEQLEVIESMGEPFSAEMGFNIPVSKDGKGYKLDPSSMGKVKIGMFTELEGKIKQVGLQAKSIPLATSYLMYYENVKSNQGEIKRVLTKFRGGSINKIDLLQSEYLVVESPVEKSGLELTSFDITIYDSMGNERNFRSSGSNFSAEQMVMIKKLRSGDKFYINNFRAKALDGELRDINPILVTIN